MRELETPRLRLIPLTGEELCLCRSGRHVMEKRLGLEMTVSPLDRETAEALEAALEAMISLVEEDPENYLWNTNWEIALREQNRIIGGLCFHGPPDSEGRVQLGYIMQEAYRCRGYMTEALRAVCSWALSIPGVAMVTAETEKDNMPSQRVLVNIGMMRTRETGRTYWWALTSLRQ
ncbi:MAG: GNAT family N-acetyltransferase [Candidatus Eremiobacteraeota bacterium]|nr:GNAT family N-acetyltransferase [Candidatus Eremiobacteraeota bacterium]